MVKNVHKRQCRSAWPWTWSSRFDLPVEDTEVPKVDKRAASFVPQQTQDKNAMGNECFRQRILFIFLSTLFFHFPAFSQAACVKRALNHKIEVHVLLHFLLLCLSKIDIWAVTNTQAQHKKVKNHFLCKKSPHPQAIATYISSPLL